MSKRKKFNVHDLYPDDYCFDWDSFEKNPEGYTFTKDDIAYMNAIDLERYEAENEMSAYEKKLVRNWVLDGHSPYENPGSKYLCMTGSEPYDFLTVYRMDGEIQHEMKGMNKAERMAYLKEYMGWVDDTTESTGWYTIDSDAEDIFD